MRSFFLLAAAWIGMVGATPASSASITVTSLADFDTSVGSAMTTTDTFSNVIEGGFTITFDSGVTSSISGVSDVTEAARKNQVSSLGFLGDIKGPRLGGSVIIWRFGAPVIGFGADFSGVEQIDVSIDGGSSFIDINTEIGGTTGFFGLVDTMTPFSQVLFSVRPDASDALDNDFFFADDLIFARPAPALVPLPTAAWLLLSGLGAMGAIRLRRGKAAGNS